MASVTALRDPYVGEKDITQHREGFGVYSYDNKFFRYEGEWHKGKKHGHGKLSMADGSYYEGEFRDGEITGNGFRYYSSGNTYVGELEVGELQGQGVMKYADGSMYEGDWHCNKRQGFGVWHKPDGSVYKGHFHDSRRHGEGTQTYSDGDVYFGDWIADKRQGHGELRMKDGGMYDGQWRNNVYNGQGTLAHSSMLVYDGLWVNGRPGNQARRLVLNLSDPLDIVQGTPISLEVRCVNEDGEVVEEEEGRELHVMVGVQYSGGSKLPAADKPSNADTGDSTAGALFDMIEDLEETAVQTPFGYTIVSYPLTDATYIEELTREAGAMSGLRGSTTDMSDGLLTERSQDESKACSVDRLKAAGVQADLEGLRVSGVGKDTQADGTSVLTDGATVDALEEESGKPQEGTALPPPVANQRSRQGTAMFENMILPAAPPMYRPFAVMDDKKAKKSRSRADSKLGTEGEEQAGAASKKTQKEDCFARPGNPSSSNLTDASEGKIGQKVPKRGPKTHKGWPFAAEGEYVLVAQDVTHPAFFDERPEPAFLRVKLTAPKKQKKKGKTVDKGPSSVDGTGSTYDDDDDEEEDEDEASLTLSRTGSKPTTPRTPASQ